MTRTIAAIILLASFLASPVQAQVQQVMDEAVSEFFAGRIEESVRGFDRVVQMSPQSAPHLWQRGIALYYAGRYKDCRLQFESHRTVNPNDVENAAWHFLCVARQESAEKARAALLPVGRDGRVPMREVLEMFAGKLSADDVMKAAGSSASGQFYGNLYVGLYAEAMGDQTKAMRYLREAADPKNAAVGGYMYEVARVHVKLRESSGR